MSLYINKLITELIHLNLPEVSCSEPTCSPSLLRFGLRELTPDRYDYPVYLLVDRGAISELTPECIFCELAGGTTTRPDYWPDTK